MPLVNLKTSSNQIKNEQDLLESLSLEISRLTGKPEQYVMAIIQTGVPMSFAGTNASCCFVEVKSIGSLDPDKMTNSLCNLIESKTGIPSNRIYIAFEDFEASKWGFNRKTFG